MMTAPTSPEELNANNNHKDKNVIVYMIGHSPDAKYLKRLLPQLSAFAECLVFVNTDEGNDCAEVLESQDDIPFVYKTLLFPDREKFDFAKARNYALDLAQDCWTQEHGCYYYMWLDCDDEIPNGELLPKLMQENPSDTYALPYEVNKLFGNLNKIRIHQHGWRWVNPVHEELIWQDKDTQKTALVLKAVPVIHNPDDDKSNHDFHISLLKEEAKKAPANITYLAKEHYNSLRFEEAIEYAKQAIAIHDVDLEVYNLWMMLGTSYFRLEKFDEAVDAFHQGLKLRPWRKEAYFYLSEIYGSRGRAEDLQKGMALIESCNTLKDHQEVFQNNHIYENHCWKLHARYLQKFGDPSGAIQKVLKVQVPDEEVQTIINECNEQRAIIVEKNNNGSS